MDDRAAAAPKEFIRPRRVTLTLLDIRYVVSLSAFLCQSAERCAHKFSLVVNDADVAELADALD